MSAVSLAATNGGSLGIHKAILSAYAPLERKEYGPVIDRDRLRDLVLEVLHERFEGVDIDSITIEPDVDADGDDILLINVIFDGKNRRLDPRRATGLLRHMRPRLEEIGEKSFPVISFIAKADLRKAKSEAA